MQQQGRFILLTRDEFRNWLSKNKFTRVIELIQNHHTYIPNYSHFNGSNHFERLESMENSHVERGFDMIAQNITTFPDGTLAIGRPLDKIPAGIKGANARGICIEHLGHFDVGGDVMTEEHKKVIVFTNAALSMRFDLTPNTNSIVYHHWYDLNTGQRTNGTGSTKSCPGTNFFGGNKVQDAQANFIPLISQELALLKGTKIIPIANAELPKGIVIGDVLNVRSGPGASFGKVNALKKGVTVAIHKEQDGWLRIDKSSMWVSARYIQRV